MTLTTVRSGRGERSVIQWKDNVDERVRIMNATISYSDRMRRETRPNDECYLCVKYKRLQRRCGEHIWELRGAFNKKKWKTNNRRISYIRSEKTEKTIGSRDAIIRDWKYDVHTNLEDSPRLHKRRNPQTHRKYSADNICGRSYKSNCNTGRLMSETNMTTTNNLEKDGIRKAKTKDSMPYIQENKEDVLYVPSKISIR